MESIKLEMMHDIIHRNATTALNQADSYTSIDAALEAYRINAVATLTSLYKGPQGFWTYFSDAWKVQADKALSVHNHLEVWRKACQSQKVS